MPLGIIYNHFSIKRPVETVIINCLLLIRKYRLCEKHNPSMCLLDALICVYRTIASKNPKP